MSEHFVRHILRAGDYVATEFECRDSVGDIAFGNTLTKG